MLSYKQLIGQPFSDTILPVYYTFTALQDKKTEQAQSNMIPIPSNMFHPAIPLMRESAFFSFRPIGRWKRSAQPRLKIQFVILERTPYHSWRTGIKKGVPLYSNLC